MPQSYEEYARQVEEVKGSILCALEDKIDGKIPLILLREVNAITDGVEVTVPILQAAYDDLYREGKVVVLESGNLKRTPESYPPGSANV